MPTVVDSHAHIFPYLGEASGFASSEEHLLYMQLYMATHGEPVRRLADHSVVSGHTLYAGALDRRASLRADVRFRVGRFGRFEWTIDDGSDVYLQFFPPSLQAMDSPPQFLLQQMARAGVDRAVLQNARPYGRLNAYFAEAVRAHPDKFIGLADIDEARADTTVEIDGLRHAVRELGMRGLYYANRALIMDDYARMFDDPAFDPLWEEVQGLGIPIFWEIVGIPNPADVVPEIDRLNRWASRWPAIPSVWTHGFAPELLAQMPEALESLLARPQVVVEILYPIHWARTHEYPFPELRPALAKLFRYTGRDRLAWGSDMPNVERNCTYRQSLAYLPLVAEGLLPPSAVDQILGENIMRLLRTH